MYITTEISTDDGEFKLSVLTEINEDGSLKQIMPSFSSYIEGKLLFMWDHPKYMLDELYPYLKGEREDNDLDEIFSSHKDEIFEMFETGIKLGFFGNEI